MLVYGDRRRTQDPQALIGRIRERLDGLARTSPGIARHGALAGSFIEAGRLAQGLADAEFEARGADGPSPIQDAAMALLMHLARALAASWRSDFTALPPDCAAELKALAALPLPPTITTTTPEGYAFYAVYPEAYLEAAAALPEPAEVVGLRSIGTGLAAMVAVGSGAPSPLTVRPFGHPFARQVKLLQPPDPARAYAIVDEGPGLSGSSFGALADLLEDAGVPAEAITFFPSHGGDPGPQASARHRARWSLARRLVRDFDEVVLDRLPAWFIDLVGGPAKPLEDLSGGQWRRGRAIPADPQRERRKYLLHTASGAWLLKFVGLGRIGEEKVARARALHEAGFCPEPLAVRHGFMVERWHEDTRPPAPADRPALLARLGDYLAFRSETFPAGDDEGADYAQLREMATHNAGLAVTAPHAPPRRVRTDNRLHAWEWLKLSDGRLLKTDAVDHDDAHDLIGCQDIAWDIAGAAVEFGLSAGEAARLCEATDRDPGLLAFYVPCYAAFQLGLWTFAGDDAQVARYRAALAQDP